MSSISYEKRGKIVIVTLERPPINALIKETYLEIKNVFEEIGRIEGVSVAVLKAEGRFFCPGNDVKDFLAIGESSNPSDYAEAVSAGISAVYDCEIPVVAAVHGHAMGAGMALAACSDVLIASPDAQFGLPEIRVGIIGASAFLSLLVPEKVVRYMALTGKPITATQVYGYGGIHELVDSDKVFDKAIEVASMIAENSPTAIRYFKKSMNINQNEQLVEKYSVEASMTAKFVSSDEFNESVMAFIENRKPEFK